LLFIIPGIIFAIFWAFASYVYLIEKAGVFESIRGSKKLVKGRWWSVFWTFVLFGLCMMLVYFPIIIFGGVAFIIGLSQITIDYVAQIVGMLYALFLTPFSIAFSMVFYQALKKNPVE
jgi:hypothetical protein